ncbi:hypothetical protein HAX54_023243, partial [Datura stramonium]|nr:hypothetical protein [Datura stramonium]
TSLLIEDVDPSTVQDRVFLLSPEPTYVESLEARSLVSLESPNSSEGKRSRYLTHENPDFKKVNYGSLDFNIEIVKSQTLIDLSSSLDRESEEYYFFLEEDISSDRLSSSSSGDNDYD